MPCTSPIKGFRSPHGVVFHRRGAWIDRPVTVPCGQCMDCRLSRSSHWAVRCMHESQFHEANSFVTLTYDDEHLPKDASLDVTHWQKFAKRLRIAAGPFRYLHCGEYGSKNARPHYHAVVHGLDFTNDRIRYGGTTERPLYTSELLTETWGKGLAIIGALNYQTAAYVARYIVKKVTGEAAHAHYSRIDKTTGEETQVKPEYITMSRRPGLGSKWFEKYMEELYPNDFVVLDQKKYAVPKYYDRLLESMDPERLATLQAGRINKAKLRDADQTPDRLHTRRVHTRLKYDHFNERNL